MQKKNCDTSVKYKMVTVEQKCGTKVWNKKCETKKVQNKNLQSKKFKGGRDPRDKCKCKKIPAEKKWNKKCRTKNMKQKMQNKNLWNKKCRTKVCEKNSKVVVTLQTNVSAKSWEQKMWNKKWWGPSRQIVEQKCGTKMAKQNLQNTKFKGSRDPADKCQCKNVTAKQEMGNKECRTKSTEQKVCNKIF